MRKPSFSADEIHEAYMDCRRRKRGTANALRFEMNQAEHLLDLEEELNSGSYRPSRSVCFVNLRPKPREIFAADFRDRVVHHLFVREIEDHWERVFMAVEFGPASAVALSRESESRMCAVSCQRSSVTDLPKRGYGDVRRTHRPLP